MVTRSASLTDTTRATRAASASSSSPVGSPRSATSTSSSSPVGSPRSAASTSMQQPPRSPRTPVVSKKIVSDILSAMPGPSITKPDWSQSLQQLAMTAFAVFLSFSFLRAAPWYLLPVAWLATGLSFCMLFMIASDCARNIYTPSPTLNYLLGHIATLPFMKSLSELQIEKSAQLGKGVGNTSIDENPEQLGGASDPGVYDDSTPIYVQLKEKLFPSLALPPAQRLTLAISATTVYVLLAAILALIYHQGGVLAVAKYYVLPLLAYRVLYATSYDTLTQSVQAHLASDVTVSIPYYNLPKLSHAILVYLHKQGEASVDAAMLQSQSWSQFIADIWPRLNWLHMVFLIVAPIVGFYLSHSTPLTAKTLAWTLFYYVFTGLGITAGYHRLFSHRAYDAHPVVNALMMFMGTGALEGSVKFWCTTHRLHHRYTDTLYDPYNAMNGMFYSHIGWMLVNQQKEYKLKADIADLNASAMLRWQHRNYIWFGPFTAVVFPALVASLWGDFMGGLVYAGFLRMFFVHHATFCINSLAHYLGDQPFDDSRTPRDNIITALVTFGEGYHNFHHEFPNDYRNGIRWYDYDPTKWLIKTLNLLGLAWKLRVFPANEIEKGRVLMQQKQVSELRSHVSYPAPRDTLPPMTWSEFRAEGQAYLNDTSRSYVKPGKRALIAIEGIVHDLSSFIPRHPGGEAFIKSAIGTNATVRFRGDTGIYQHSQAAYHLISTFRVARLVLTEQEKEQLRQEEQKQLEAHHPKGKIIPKVVDYDD